MLLLVVIVAHLLLGVDYAWLLLHHHWLLLVHPVHHLLLLGHLARHLHAHHGCSGSVDRDLNGGAMRNGVFWLYFLAIYHFYYF